MARNRRTRGFDDLFEYHGCRAERDIGLAPLGVGFLTGKQFPTGEVKPGFVEKLAAFCHPDLLVCRTQGRRRCAVDNAFVAYGDLDLGSGELRILGESDIYAAPDLILHYIVEHGYIPPPAFIKAVEESEPAGTGAHGAYVNTLRGAY